MQVEDASRLAKGYKTPLRTHVLLSFCKSVSRQAEQESQKYQGWTTDQAAGDQRVPPKNDQNIAMSREGQHIELSWSTNFRGTKLLKPKKQLFFYFFKKYPMAESIPTVSDKGRFDQ
jgi:hypothetical protein